MERSMASPKEARSVPTSATGKPRQQVSGSGATSAPTRTASATRPQVPGGKDAPRPEKRTWTQVVKKGKKGGDGRAKVASAATKPGQEGKVKGKNPPPPPSSTPQKKRRRAPRTAAVTLTCPENMYTECMGMVRQKIKLEEVGIVKPLNIRRTATGAFSLEVSGQGNAEKADALANKMAEVLANSEGVRIFRPTMMADVRLIGFEESISESEIKDAIARKGNTQPLNVSVGPIRRAANGMCTTVAKCPLSVANAVAKENRITLGWSTARIEILDKRPLQCFKCLELGHTRAMCKSEVDRTGACYRCGEIGHPARSCGAPVKCAVCAGKGVPHNHRIGGPSCAGGRKGTRKGAEKAKSADKSKPGDKDKTKSKPKKVDEVVVSGFKVTSDGKIIAGVLGPGTKNQVPTKKGKGKTKPQKKDSAEGMEVEVLPTKEGEDKTFEAMEIAEEVGDSIPRETKEGREEDSTAKV